MQLNLTNTHELMKSPGRGNEIGKDQLEDTLEKPAEKVVNKLPS